MPSRCNSRIAFWQWPNVLGLDAPFVALLWQAFLAQLFAVPLRTAGRVALGLTVWAIYLADRILDARDPHLAEQSARHRFARRHQRAMSIALAVSILADLLVSLFWLRHSVILNGLVPLAGVLLYLGVLHASSGNVRIAKEPTVAFLFTVGTFLVAWTNAPAPSDLLVGPALSFFFLCLMNLLAIEKWEWRELQRSAPHPATALLIRSLPLGLVLLAAVSILQRGAWHDAIAASAISIAIIILAGQRLSLELRRTLIDAALCTPLVFLL
ncbi:hypothetical protein [Bryobacter aggregatus]|uniref:hypothetical protein n=1 Tax=Bryobacter aggregatus TaxID=360054 RepID=UPI00056AAE1A|nr:hypothetical protein [Bryobacter aggregatus]